MGDKKKKKIHLSTESLVARLKTRPNAGDDTKNRSKKVTSRSAPPETKKIPQKNEKSTFPDESLNGGSPPENLRTFSHPNLT
jgi:hypothetical protein